MIQLQKYGRTLHAQISLGTTSDDRILPNGYVQAFANFNDLVMLEKLDGQNCCFKKSGVYARSHTSPTIHPWDKPMRERWNLIKNDLDDLEIFGEGMYARHSIAYKNLESYYYVFGIRQKDYWLPWEEVKFYAEMFDFPVVPEIPLKTKLKDFYHDDVSENKLLEMWLKENLGMSWEDSVKTPGMLGGYDAISGEDASEGFVIRNSNGFYMNDGVIPVEYNEFNNLLKIVRHGHVQTDEHWTKTWKPATLVDYNKYGWYGYDYLGSK